MMPVGSQFPSTGRRDTVANVARRLYVAIIVYWPNLFAEEGGTEVLIIAPSPGKR